MSKYDETLRLIADIDTLFKRLERNVGETDLELEPTLSHWDVGETLHEIRIMLADVHATAREARTWRKGVTL